MMFYKLLLVLTWLVVSVKSELPCSRVESVNITLGVAAENGSIVHAGVVYEKGTWYSVVEDGISSTLGCPCIGRTCVWKCCASGQAMGVVDFKTCNDTDLTEVNPFSPPVYNHSTLLDIVAYKHFFYMYSSLCVDRYLVDSNNSNEEIYIQADGTLVEDAYGQQQQHPATGYCVEYMAGGGGSARLVAAVCLPDDLPTEDSPALYIAYAVGLILSTPFLLATMLVYACIPELRNLHGLCLTAYCGGLIIAYPLLAYLKLSNETLEINMAGCYAVAFLVFFSFQTSFFWLNVMCFDIWRTFSGYRGGSGHKRRERRRFLLYGAYAWGVPLLLTGVTIFMQFANDLPLHVIRPGFGWKRCWFPDWLNEALYFWLPVLVLVVCNIVLFSVTAYRIRSIKQETAILKGSESARSDKLNKDKQRYVLYLKLFMVMGVNWFVEVFSFVVGGSNWYWALTDLSNLMLGLFIFLIFVWKNKVRMLVRKKWGHWVGVASAVDTRSSTLATEDTRVTHDESAIKLKEMH